MTGQRQKDILAYLRSETVAHSTGQYRNATVIGEAVRLPSWRVRWIVQSIRRIEGVHAASDGSVAMACCQQDEKCVCARPLNPQDE